MRAKMTYELAMAAAKDAAERNRRARHDTRWNAEDYRMAVETFCHLFPRRGPSEQPRAAAI